MTALVAALVAAVVLAGQVDLTPEEAGDLATRAATDPAAAGELAAVESVAGGPVDFDEVVSRSPAAALPVVARIPVTGVDGAEVEATVDRVLSSPRFGRRAEGWFDRLTRQVGAFFVDLFGRIASWLGGSLVAALAAGAGLAVVTGLVVARLARRRLRQADQRAHLERALAAGEDPDDVERRADRAAEAGDHAAAVRLRFVAGLLRLDRQARIALRPGLTTHRIQSAVSDPVFDRLAARFEEVAYGGAPAGPDDDRRAREDWDRVLGRARA